MIRTLESLYSRPMQLKGFTARYGKRPKQRGFYKRYGFDEVDLPGNREHIKEMDTASSKLGFDSSETLHKIWGQDENRLVIFNPKSKESTGVEIWKG